MSKDTQAQWPEVTREIIAYNCTEKVLERGENLFRAGDILSLVRRGDELHADVSGSEPEPHHIRVMLGNDDIDAAVCSCPYEHGVWCKHLVAVMFFVVEARDEIEIEASLYEILATSKAEQLREVLARMAEDEPTMENIVRAYLKGEKPKWPREYEDYDEDKWN